LVQLCCMTYVYQHYSMERALEGIAKAGYKYVAIGLPHEKVTIPDEDDANAAEQMQCLFERYGVEPLMLLSTKSLVPSQPMEQAIKRLELARSLGIKEVFSLGTFGYNKFPDEPRTPEEMDPLNRQFVEKFRLVCKEAEKRELFISVKPHTGNTATAQQLKQLMEEIGSPSFKVSYDPGNVRFYEGIDTVGDFKSIVDDTISFIAKDHQGARANAMFPVPGQGDVDFLSMFRLLRERNYEGPVVVERVDEDAKAGVIEAEALDERIAAARRNLVSLLAEAGYKDIM
jgi:sugar phosphate isomerase/epimerase